LCLLVYRPDDRCDDSGDESSTDGQLIIDVSSRDKAEAPAHSPISSIGDATVAANLPTGDGVFSPFSPVSAGGVSNYTLHSMSISLLGSPVGALYSVEEELARL
jgi:hypothetical protein